MRAVLPHDGNERAETRGLELARGILEPELAPPQRHTGIAARAWKRVGIAADEVSALLHGTHVC